MVGGCARLPQVSEKQSASADEEPKVRIVLIEDHADFRESVSMVLEQRGRYECVGEFSNMEDAIEEFRAGLETDLVLSDLGLPGMSGIDGIHPPWQSRPRQIDHPITHTFHS